MGNLLQPMAFERLDQVEAWLQGTKRPQSHTLAFLLPANVRLCSYSMSFLFLIKKNLRTLSSESS